eukprot:1428798-Prymnesium_polylepis.1
MHCRRASRRPSLPLHDLVSRSKSCPRRRSSPWTSRHKLGISGVSTRLHDLDSLPQRAHEAEAA